MGPIFSVFLLEILWSENDVFLVSGAWWCYSKQGIILFYQKSLKLSFESVLFLFQPYDGSDLQMCNSRWEQFSLTDWAKRQWKINGKQKWIENVDTQHQSCQEIGTSLLTILRLIPRTTVTSLTRPSIHAARRILYTSISVFLFERVRKHTSCARSDKRLPPEYALTSRSFSRWDQV